MLAVDRARLDKAAEDCLAPLKASVAMNRLKLDHAVETAVQAKHQRLARDRTRLEALSPRQVLERGYAVVTGEKGLVTSSAAARTESVMTLHFSDGSIQVQHKEE